MLLGSVSALVCLLSELGSNTAVASLSFAHFGAKRGSMGHGSADLAHSGHVRGNARLCVARSFSYAGDRLWQWPHSGARNGKGRCLDGLDRHPPIDLALWLVMGLPSCTLLFARVGPLITLTNS